MSRDEDRVLRAQANHHARARVDNYTTKYVTKMKAKFSYCNQIKFNETVLKPGILGISEHCLLLTVLRRILLVYLCK